jgi:PAS domain S-box-containing protein
LSRHRGRGAGKRDELIDAALRLFARHGYRATGIDTILAEAGAAKMTLYHHFKSKDELIVATLQRCDAEWRAWFQQRVDELADTSREKTGAEFFPALVKNLAAVMGTAGAWVTEYLPEARRLRAHAFWLNGSFLPAYEHPVDGTPCCAVVEEKRLLHIPDRIVEIYSDEADLRAMKAVSYMGAPLPDTDGAVMGHLAVLDTKPLPSEPRLLSLFETFAARAAAEQRRLKQEAEVRAREEQLDALLPAAMDAILVLDQNYCVVRVNPAAEKLFGFETRALAGARLRDLLDNDSAARLPALVQELEQQPDGARQLWIPQHLGAVRADGAAFPAEATLSGFTLRGETFHALIMRSVDERIAAEKRIRLLLDEAENLRESAGIGEMLGQSTAMKELFTSLRRVAATDATVLVLGETGTGKELIARSLHETSARKEKPLVRVNCAAIPGTLMESEFFGHERGAFTGATVRREGRFALADGGTMFLDQVGELPLDLQAKLLRVLQEGEFEPLGGTRTRKVNVRVVAATNRDLADLVRGGKYREDLFYRLNGFPLRVPPLRERGADIALLAGAFVERFARRMGRRIEPLHAEAVARLRDYAWPGNVRELQNVIERAIILSPGSRLELYRAMPAASVTVPPPDAGTEEARIHTAAEMESLERANIERALAACGGKISGETGAAQRLGLAPSTLSSGMMALGIQRKG